MSEIPEYTVTIGWVEIERVWDGVDRRIDIGERPKFKDVKNPKVCVWMLDAKRSDLHKALAYCVSDGRDRNMKAFLLIRCKDPIAETKRRLLEE